MIEIKNTSFDYIKGQRTLDSININIRKGECVLLCGESGCGKTTVTMLINGLIPHFEENGELRGTVTVAGLDTAKAELYQLSSYVGSVFQNPKSQFFHTDAESEIVFGLENSGTDPAIIRNRLDDTVRELGIRSILGRRVFSMSGGEKQMLAFASVYAMGADIFVLDEPTANLDEGVIALLAKLIRKCKADGKTVVIAEHRLYFLMELIDRAIYMEKGSVVREFTQKQFSMLSDSERIAMGLRTLKKTELIPRIASGKHNIKKGLEVRGLSFRYGKQKVFSGLDLNAGYGEIIGIIGKNGAGKSTLSRCLCGLIKESSGEILLDGHRLKARTRRKESFLVMQDVNHQLFSNSVTNECNMSSEYVSKEEADQVLSLLDLADFRDKHPMALSGGQKQRLAVATAILSGKKILIFDEPSSGLDYRRMESVSSMLKKIATDDRIIIVVSHDYELLNNICDRCFCVTGEREQ